MTRRTIRQTYRRFRAAGLGALDAWRSTKIAARFERLADLELVRLGAENDPEDYFSVWGEPDDERERAAIVRMLERGGNYIVYSELRCPCCGKWEAVDSVGQCAGYDDPRDAAQNCYVPDLMRTAIDGWREKRREHRRTVAV